MTAVEKYEELIQNGLITPPAATPLNFKFPSLLVHVPTVTTNGTTDPRQIQKVRDAQLERYPK
jgi:hypothetical protein